MSSCFVDGGRPRDCKLIVKCRARSEDYKDERNANNQASDRGIGVRESIPNDARRRRRHFDLREPFGLLSERTVSLFATGLYEIE